MAIHHRLVLLLVLRISLQVIVKPSSNFIFCDDFFVLVVTCHIITAARLLLGMPSLSDTPSNAVVLDADRCLQSKKIEK